MIHAKKETFIPFCNVIWVFIKLHNEGYAIWTIQMNSSWEEILVIPTWSFDDPTLLESGSFPWIKHQLPTFSAFRPIYIVYTYRYNAHILWVPNLVETTSHCPTDDSEMSQCDIVKSKHFYSSQIAGLPVSLVVKNRNTKLLITGVPQQPPQGKIFEKIMEVKKCESRIMYFNTVILDW